MNIQEATPTAAEIIDYYSGDNRPIKSQYIEDIRNKINKKVVQLFDYALEDIKKEKTINDITIRNIVEKLNNWILYFEKRQKDSGVSYFNKIYNIKDAINIIQSYEQQHRGFYEGEKKGVDEIKRIKGKNIKKKTITEVINEILDVGEIDVENLKKKEELSSKIWDGDEMIPEVRKSLLKNALAFIKFLDLEDVTFKDITLTGSLANYNWTENSDLDVHLLFDFSQIGEDDEFLDDYFRTKKALWTERMPIKIKGFDVEVYVQNANKPHTSSGVFSIMKNKWLTKPIQDMIAIDISNIKSKAKYIADMIDEIDEYEDDEKINVIDKFMEKLRLFRQSGLEDGGEFSTENLVFKGLRHSGYLDKLIQMKKESITKELSLENNIIGLN